MTCESLRSNWQMFFKFDGKFDFKEIFSQILDQAENFGRLFVFLQSALLKFTIFEKWLTTSANYRMNLRQTDHLFSSISHSQ